MPRFAAPRKARNFNRGETVVGEDFDPYRQKPAGLAMSIPIFRAKNNEPVRTTFDPDLAPVSQNHMTGHWSGFHEQYALGYVGSQSRTWSKDDMLMMFASRVYEPLD
jgi:hypothetical protein